MVQEKDAAKKREAERAEFARKSAEDLKRRTIKFKWTVMEQTPSWVDSGYYGEVYHEAVTRTVSPEFDTKEEAQEWMDRHEPDKGNILFVQRWRLVKREWTEWVSY